MRRILIADDEIGFCNLLRLNLLESNHCEVELAHAGGEVLEAARRFNPDIILLDCVMPDISGREVAARLKADPELSRIPVVFLTGSISRTEIVSHSGLLDGHPALSKPVSTKELLETVDAVLEAP